MRKIHGQVTLGEQNRPMQMRVKVYVNDNTLDIDDETSYNKNGWAKHQIRNVWMTIHQDINDETSDVKDGAWWDMV